MQLAKHMSISAVLLGLFAIIGSGLVALTYQNTAATIAANERAYLLSNLHTLIPPRAHDNKLIHDTLEVTNKELLGSAKPLTIYRARNNGQPVAAILSVIAPDGYNGRIKLLIAIRDDGELVGVRVINHSETPGLGDAIEAERSDWIHEFAGKSLDNPKPRAWAVKKDGGVFDQFTGATVTPRAVVKAVHNALKYYAENRERIFRQETGQTAG